jgi:hypothetical protein
MLTITLSAPKVEQAEVLLRDYPRRLSFALKIAMRNTVVEILYRLKSLVPVKTGTLRRSWQAKPLEQNTDGIGWVSGMGTNLQYAAAVEFGKHEPENVKAYARRNRSRTQFEKTAGGANRKLHGRKVGAMTGFASVRAFTRQPNMKAQPYARPALSEGQEAVRRLHEIAIAAEHAKMKAELRG